MKKRVSKKLTCEEYHVLKEGGTELPFTGSLLHEHGEGVFSCKACGNIIFDSKAKYDSGTGWPSFYDAKKGSVLLKEDNSLGMKRIEALCAKCGSHLGHVFSNEPTPTGKRYCINSVSLNFKKSRK